MRVALRTLGVAGLLAAVGLSLSAAPTALADEAITHQPYADLLGIKALHEKGYTGEGVTIAYVEAPPDTSVPELQGVNVEVRSPECEMPRDPKQVSHSTLVASILGNPDWGWAPKATIVNYTALYRETAEHPCADPANGANQQINRALSDGVDIVSISLGGTSDLEAATMARAAQLGVPIIAAADNFGEDESVGWGRFNTVISVGSTDLEGQLSEFSSYGPHLTVVAPGEQVTGREPDDEGNLTRITTGHAGTSYSTPTVAGVMALAMQRWPEATGNQLIRSLINTADNNGQGRTDEYGYGLLDVAEFLNTDPTTLEDTNPLWDKYPGAIPNADTLADYQDGLIDPSALVGDTSYTYRGVDDAIVQTYPEISEFGTSPRYRR